MTTLGMALFRVYPDDIAMRAREKVLTTQEIAGKEGILAAPIRSGEDEEEQKPFEKMHGAISCCCCGRRFGLITTEATT